MTDRFIKVPSDQIRLGMFVTELDKPWLETPFLVQGFVVKDATQRKILMEQCQYVVVDIGKSDKKLIASSKRKSIGKSLQETFPRTKLKVYEDKHSFEEELPNAEKIYQEYEQTVSKIYDEYKHSKKINLRSANEAASSIVSSIVHNPDACILLQQMRRKGDYLYNHAIGTSIWAASLARQIGLPKSDLKLVALGGLLCDIGKLNISSRILEKPTELDEQEFSLIKEHVVLDNQFNEQYPGLADAILQIIQCHHERHDGSGYPQGLIGDNIPVYARIVGIADSYDAMTNHRSHAKALPPYAAVKELYELRDIQFQAEIVEEFIQATGIYPVGTLVELNSGEVGVVIAEYRTRRMRPKLLMLLDSSKAFYEETRYLDLSDKENDAYAISASLETGAYGLDADDFFQ